MRFPSTISLLAWASWLALAAGADGPSVVALWPGNAQMRPGDIGPERSRMSPELDRKQVEVTQSTRMITNVARPSITICRPAKENETGTAMLICPGGGY